MPKARVNWSRWIVDCASPICTSAMTLGDEREDRAGNVWPGLVIGQSTMRCRDCGFLTEGIEWPPDPLAIETVLSWRPDEKTRNWEPGEMIADLLRENVEHGVPIPGVPVLEPGQEFQLMQEVGGVVTGGYIGELLALAAPSQREIGA